MGDDAHSLADLAAMLRTAGTARVMSGGDAKGADVDASRREIAEFCRYLGARLKGEATVEPERTPSLPAGLKLSPRMRQTLERLLAGDSEKQIAARLSVSPHTVHVYVKALYRGFEVSSRGELLARYVKSPLTE